MLFLFSVEFVQVSYVISSFQRPKNPGTWEVEATVLNSELINYVSLGFLAQPHNSNKMSNFSPIFSCNEDNIIVFLITLEGDFSPIIVCLIVYLRQSLTIYIPRLIILFPQLPGSGIQISLVPCLALICFNIVKVTQYILKSNFQTMQSKFRISMVTVIRMCQEKRYPDLLLSLYCDVCIIKLKERTQLLVITENSEIIFFSKISNCQGTEVFQIVGRFGFQKYISACTYS